MNTYDLRLHREPNAMTDNPPPYRRRNVRAVSSEELFMPGEHELSISHGDAVYSLKITKQGKLVLNK